MVKRLKLYWPFPRGMKNPENFYGTVFHAIGNDVWEVRNNKFSGSFNPSPSAYRGLFHQYLYRVKNSFSYCHCRIRMLLCNIGAYGNKISHGLGKPPYFHRGAAFSFLDPHVLSQVLTSS